MSMQETRDFATSLLIAPEMTTSHIAAASKIIHTLCDVIETRAPEATRTPEQTMQLIELINWHISQPEQTGIHGKAIRLLMGLL